MIDLFKYMYLDWIPFHSKVEILKRGSYTVYKCLSGHPPDFFKDLFTRNADVSVN